jgi:hypothetical protein
VRLLQLMVRPCPIGIVSEQLSSLLQLLIPSSSKNSPRVLLGIGERTLASSISQQQKIPCDTGERTLELVRGIRLHAELFLSKAGTGMTKGDVKMAQLGLGHSYSRGKVKVRRISFIFSKYLLADLAANPCVRKLVQRQPI